MTLHTLIFNPFGENTYVGILPEGKCVLVDCGAWEKNEWELLDIFLERQQLTPVAHLLTHAHLDHLFGAAHLYERYGLRPVVSRKDLTLYQALPEQCRMFGFPMPEGELPEPLLLEESGELLQKLGAEAIPTPGHTEGGVCYYFEADHLLLTGDTLFRGGVGRTDLPGGDYATIQQSLHQLMKRFSQADDIRFYPGHGMGGFLQDEWRSNPYL